MKILEDLELRQVNTLDLPADKNKWPVTVTVQELDALIRVARNAEEVTDEYSAVTEEDEWDHPVFKLRRAVQQLRGLSHQGHEDNGREGGESV